MPSVHTDQMEESTGRFTTRVGHPAVQRPARMKAKVSAHLQLMRLPNVFTAAADALAGYLIVQGFGVHWPTLLALLLASACIYAAGCVLNDLCDWRLDSVERPSRPLPAGAVSMETAFLLTCALFALGLGAASLAGRHALAVACLLVFAVISYDAFTKDGAGPFNMALCRALNLTLGMSPGLLLPGIHWAFPLVSFTYVYALTELSRYELGEGGLGQRRRVILGGWTAVVAALLVLTLTGQLAAGALALLALFAFLTGAPLAEALRNPTPPRVQWAVKVLVLSIPLIDGLYVWGVHGGSGGLCVALFALPGLFLARRFHVT